VTTKEEYDATANSTVYRRLSKWTHAFCPLCPWRRGENRTADRQRSWKKFRRTKFRP
jgi:hypothetical protein